MWRVANIKLVRLALLFCFVAACTELEGLRQPDRPN